MSILLPENAVTVIRGASKTLKLTVKDKKGELVDLTGATIYFTVKRKETDEECVIQLAIENHIVGRIGPYDVSADLERPFGGISNHVGKRDRASWKLTEAADAAQQALCDWLRR